MSFQYKYKANAIYTELTISKVYDVVDDEDDRCELLACIKLHGLVYQHRGRLSRMKSVIPRREKFNKSRFLMLPCESNHAECSSVYTQVAKRHTCNRIA